MFFNSPHFRKIKIYFSAQQVDGLLRRSRDVQPFVSPDSRCVLNCNLDQAAGLQNRGRGGFALVFALAMLVLLMTIVLAYFSNAMLHRQIGVASAANLKVQLITKTAADLILDDFQHEIEAGSLADGNSSLTMPVRRPITLTANGTGVTNMLAPSVVPQRIGDGGVTNIVKVSRSGLSFFTSGSGYTNLANRASDGLARASAVSTTNTSANGRFLTKERWLAPKLVSDSETNAFTVPDWIYLNRKGETPTDFSGSGLATAANSNSTNTEFVIGRYAYTVYDVGGLLDINVIGNALPATSNAIRGLAHQVSLSNGIGGVSVPNFKNFVDWRSAVSSTNTNAASGSGGLFDPKRNFIDVPASEQAFVNRQDLLNYVAQSGSPIPSAALPFLTTFSRDLNAPSYEPNSARPKLPASPAPDFMNPALLGVRFQTNTILRRPEGNVTVTSGTPVMPRRFPLSKLSLFEQENPDAATMSYYFGLKKVDSQTWSYIAANADGWISTLSEVAALGREPNFFEVLQAGIYYGSLGKFAANTYTTDVDILPAKSDGTYGPGPDRIPQLQLFQIGANIIDQWDANDIPTCLFFPLGTTADVDVFGIENLPYLSQIGLAGWRPPDNKNLFQIWALFDVWNPHQNAKTPPSGISQFRIKPVGGARTASIYYYIYSSNSTLMNGACLDLRKEPSSGGTLFPTTSQFLTEINSGKEFTFSASSDYSTNTTLGTTPTKSTDLPGLLLCNATLNPAVPARGSRTYNLQLTLNKFMDTLSVSKYIPSNNSIKTNALGEIIYPPGTTFNNLKANYWMQSVDASGNITVSANFGVKAPNTFRLLNNPSSPYAFDMQAQLTNGSWITYQRLEGLYRQLDIVSSPVQSLAETAEKDDMLKNTDFSMPDSPQQNEFYKWRSRGGGGMIKTDPRTMRLGLSAWNQINGSTNYSPQNDNLGLSVRISTNAFNPSSYYDLLGTNFCIPNGIYSSGWNGTLAGGFQVATGLTKPPLFGLVSNNPDILNAANPTRYPDPDGIIRPGDGYFGGIPTARGQFADRPILLNRAFRSVGELGHVFRDIPWKTLDFFSRRSGDLGLLDVFSISETDGSPPLAAGKINLNTRQTAALAAALLNSSKQLPGVNADVPSSELTDLQAQTIAQAIVRESTARPFLDRGDIVSRVLNAGTGTDPFAGDKSKVAREAAIRTLAEIGTTRTWNFMIDLVAQTGRFTTASKSGSDFTVQSEERVWIHVAIDRMTGEILEVKKENVDE